MKTKKSRTTTKKVKTSKKGKQIVESFDSEQEGKGQLNNYREFFQYLLSNEVDRELVDVDEA